MWKRFTNSKASKTATAHQKGEKVILSEKHVKIPHYNAKELRMVIYDSC